MFGLLNIPHHFPCISYFLKWSQILAQEELRQKKLRSLCAILVHRYPEKIGLCPVSSGTFCTATFSGTVSSHGMEYFIQPNPDTHTILKLGEEAKTSLRKLIYKKFTVHLSSLPILRWISKDIF